MEKRCSEIVMAGRSLSLKQIHLIQSVHRLVRSDERLLQFLFHHKECRLRDTVKEILKEAKALNHDERVLVQIAIDMWSGDGGTRLSDILDLIDEDNFLSLIRALLYYRDIGEERWCDLLGEPC